MNNINNINNIMDIDYNHGNTSTKGLLIFVGMQLLNLGGLVTDYLLIQSNKTTITEVSVKHPVIGVGLCMIEIIPPIALGVHFWYSSYNSIRDEEHTYTDI